MGGGAILANRLEEMRKERFRLGGMCTNKNKTGSFLKTFRRGIAADVGGSAQHSSVSSGNKLNPIIKEGAIIGNQARTVIEDDLLGALRFKSKEATPTILKFNSERVFR